MKQVSLILILIFIAHSCQPNCNSCPNSFCTACAANHQLTLQAQCQASTITGCTLYTSNGNCASCQPTFTLYNQTCQKIYDGCLHRQLDNSCDLCATGKTLLNFTCVGTLNCLEGGTVCVKCREGFVLREGVCFDETDECMVADSLNGVCAMCSPGYELIGYECLPQTIRPSNCYIYNKTGFCLTCKMGYTSNPLGRCVIPGNSVCREFDQNQNCLVCAIEKLRIVNGSCIDIHCKVGAPGNCQTCQVGYAVKSDGNVCEIVDPNCQNFSLQSVSRCETCKSGYFITINGTCSKLPTNCAAANIITSVCISCSPGYTINQAGECKPPIQIPNCQQINYSTATCNLCSSGYFSSGASCTRVSSLCLGYDPTTGSCLNCKTGYTNFGGKCIDQNCQQSSGDICLQCKQNFSPDSLSGACRFADPNCASLSFLSCNSCKNGYYLNPIICVAYPPFCAQMSNDYSTCVACRTGWSLINGQCVVPVINCMSYTYNGSLSLCKSCVQNYQLVNSTCVYVAPSSTLDKNCVQSSNSLCLRCSNRYYLSNRTCIPVNPNCKNFSNDGNCTECYVGYMVSGGNCILSSVQMNQNCKNIVNGTCTLCYSGYYLDQVTKNCIAISPLCKQSNQNTGMCLSCYLGYTLINGMCISTSKDPNCIQFNLNGICQTCSSRFFMKGTLCTPVSPLCKTYNTTTGNCLSCYPGYYLLNGSCFVGVNPNSDPNCNLRDATGKCIQCYSSYYIAANATCILANPLCKTLNISTGGCLSCYGGYTLDSGNCVVSSSNNSDPNCIKFLNGVCQECYTGFYVGSGVCTRINLLCKTYNSANGECLSCYPGYSLSNGLCSIPQSYTLSVQDPYCTQRSGSTCIQCSSGYIPISGVCQAVNPLCKSLDQKGGCTSCYPGYTLQNSNCAVAQVVSIPFCQTLSNGVCQKCIQGYYMQTPTQCSPVSILCSTYDQNTGSCLSCITGYFLQVGQCIYPAMGFDQNCMNYDVSAYCSSCKPGYYLLNYVCTRVDPFCVNFDAGSQTCKSCGGGKTPNGAQCT